MDELDQHMESTNGRIEATDKFVLQIENWLRQVAENNNQSMNQTLLLDQSLIELSNEVDRLNQTLQPEIDRLINEWNTSKKTLKQEHEETNTVITKMKQNWENKLALLKLEIKQHENTYESLNSQLEDLRNSIEADNVWRQNIKKLYKNIQSHGSRLRTLESLHRNNG